MISMSNKIIETVVWAVLDIVGSVVIEKIRR